MKDQSVFSTWVVYCAAGELIGIGFAAGGTVAALSFVGEPTSWEARLGFWFLSVPLGCIEGASVGTAQWLILRERLPRLTARSWVVATVLVAAAAWALGMLPSTLTPMADSGGDAVEPPMVAVLGLAAAGGLVGGLAFGGAQWLVLRRHVDNPGLWVLANAASWTLAMVWIFLAATVPDATTPVALVVAGGVLGGAAAGATLGVGTGLALVRLRPNSATRPDLSGRTAVITGSTGGMGIETAQALAGLGARVVVHGRTSASAGRAVEALRRLGVRGPLEFVCGDLGDLHQVRALGTDLAARFPVIDILVHNAGVQCWERSETVDGVETTLAVNVVAPHLLTQLVRPSLCASKRARVVWLSSMVHAFPSAKLDFDDLQSRDYASERTYYRSKLGTALLSRWWATELAMDGVTSNSVEPGLVATDFARDFRGVVRVMSKLMRVFMKSPKLGAATAVWVASAPELEGVTGHHYSELREKLASADARDETLGRRYVAAIEALVSPEVQPPVHPG